MAEFKGDQYVEQAKKKLSSFSWFSGNSKYEDAAELYSKAGAQFKIAKAWEKAAKAYAEAAEVSSKCGNVLDATDFYTKAAAAFKKTDPQEAVRYYNLAVTMHMEENRFSTAAKLYKTIGELSETENELEEALVAYQKAADCYLAEDSTTSANQMLTKVAHFAAKKEDYKRAIGLFEEIASSSLENNLLQWAAKDLFFKALLCHLAVGAKNNDYDDCDEAIEKYSVMYPAFEDTREHKFFVNVVESLKEGDVEKFEDAVYQFDNITKLDEWKSGILLIAKNSMREVDLT